MFLGLLFLLVIFDPMLHAEPLSSTGVPENSIRDISVSELENGVIVIQLTLDRSIDTLPTGNSLNNSEQLYFDLCGVSNGLDKYIVGKGSLRSINIVQADNRTRLVMNLSKRMIHEIQVARNKILINLKMEIGYQELASEATMQDATRLEKSSISLVKDNVVIAEEFGELDSLFSDEESDDEEFPRLSGVRGFSQFELAYTYADPEHFSKARLRTQLSNTGQLNSYIKWKISARFDYDAIYDLSDFYPRSVEKDQRAEFFLRENYLDISAGDFDFRVGRQHIVWGEMVGLFFADVVSAKDMREFVLQDFDLLRIPQWAVRAEYVKNDFHVDLIWIPFASVDKSGRPGADFFPFSLPVAASFLKEDKSRRNPAHSNYGLRLSQLADGWDLSAFYYHSIDAAPTFYRVSEATEPLIFQARHDEIDQFGATLTKDLGSAVLKGELIYTHGRKFNVLRPTQKNGLVKQNTLDYVLGLDFDLPAETLLNVQFFQRIFFSHDKDIVADKWESGASIFLKNEIRHNTEVQVLLIHSLNRSEWMLRPKLTWKFMRNWRMALGADIFSGRSTGIFGRFSQNDRVYTEWRYSF